MNKPIATVVRDDGVAGSSPATPTSLFNDLGKTSLIPCTDCCTDNPITRATVARFWAKVAIATNDRDCWVWRGAISKNGYGSFGLGGRSVSAHRVAYRIATDAWPADGLLIRHKCDNPRCVNPQHLETGTHLENSKDKVERGRTSKRDQSGQSNGAAKLNAEKVAHIRELFARGHTNVAIGKVFGVKHATISAIRRGKSWSRPSDQESKHA